MATNSDWAISDLVTATDVEQLLAKQSAWTLAQALLHKVEDCPQQGAREQCKLLMGQFFRAGGDWLYLTSIAAEKER